MAEKCILGIDRCEWDRSKRAPELERYRLTVTRHSFLSLSLGVWVNFSPEFWIAISTQPPLLDLQTASRNYHYYHISYNIYIYIYLFLFLLTIWSEEEPLLSNYVKFCICACFKSPTLAQSLWGFFFPTNIASTVNNSCLRILLLGAIWRSLVLWTTSTKCSPQVRWYTYIHTNIHTLFH